MLDLYAGYSWPERIRFWHIRDDLTEKERLTIIKERRENVRRR